MKTKVVANDYGSDAAAVGFDAIQYAKKNFIDCVLIDTAGRMHNSKNLLQELEKIKRVSQTRCPFFIPETFGFCTIPIRSNIQPPKENRLQEQ